MRFHADSYREMDASELRSEHLESVHRRRALMTHHSRPLGRSGGDTHQAVALLGCPFRAVGEDAARDADELARGDGAGELCVGVPASDRDAAVDEAVTIGGE